jgi:hypothetical protein
MSVERRRRMVEPEHPQLPIVRGGDWLVMATTLLQPEAQLLWPATPATAAQAAAEAARRLLALDALAQMQAAACWLSARSQPGHEVFPWGRGEHTPSPQAALYVAFLEATLVMREGRDGQGGAAPPVYRPAAQPARNTLDRSAHHLDRRTIPGRHRPGQASAQRSSGSR